MSRTESRLTRVRNTDPFRDACCVMQQRVEICSHHHYVDDEDDEEECSVDVGGLSVKDHAILHGSNTSPPMVRSRSSMTL